MRSHLSDFAPIGAHSDRALGLAPGDELIWEGRLYTYSYHPDLDAEDIYAGFLRWGDRFPVPPADPFPALRRDPARRLRVGYVSPDFRRHTSRFFFEPLFAHHDKSQVELFAYSNVAREDGHTERFKELFDHWRPIRGVADRVVADLVRRDRIDILVDGCNHMAGHRLAVFSVKPAPVQVTWLGSAWTTGLSMMDYVLFDRYLAPDGNLGPGTDRSSAPLLRRLPAAGADGGGGATAGAAQRLRHLRLFGSKRAAEPPGLPQLGRNIAPSARRPSHPRFHGLCRSADDYYRDVLAGQGVFNPARVVMRCSEDIFAGLADIDILLDCFPHSGGTMLLDALWMGVPFVTLASRPPVGRIGASLLRNLGLDDWVTASEPEYIDTAVAVAGDGEALAALRAGLRDRMRTSPLMDEPAFARGVESAFRTMWETWCDRQPIATRQA